MSEWQTLIGALVGFLTIAITFAGQRHYENEAEKHLINKSNIAYLKSYKAEIQFFLSDVVNYEILSEDFDESTLKECAINPPFRELQSYYIDWKFKTEDNVSAIIGQVSPPAYLLMIDTLKVKEKFMEDAYSIGMSGCSNFEWAHNHAKETIPKYTKLFNQKLQDIDVMLMEFR